LRVFAVLEELAFCHQYLGMVNLDIKPKNIFVGK
jgi:hypothetical protein